MICDIHNPNAGTLTVSTGTGEGCEYTTIEVQPESHLQVNLSAAQFGVLRRMSRESEGVRFSITEVP